MSRDFTSLFRSQSVWAVYGAGIPAETFLKVCRHFIVYVSQMRERFPNYDPSPHCGSRRVIQGKIVPVNTVFSRIVFDYVARYGLSRHAEDYIGKMVLERSVPDCRNHLIRHVGVFPHPTLVSEVATIAVELFYGGFDDFRIVRPVGIEKIGMRKRQRFQNGELNAATRFSVLLDNGERIPCVGHPSLILGSENPDGWYTLQRENDSRDFRLRASNQFSKWNLCVRQAVRRNVELRLGQRSMYIDTMIEELRESLFSRPKHEFEFPIYEMREAGLFSPKEWTIVDAWHGYNGDIIAAAASIRMNYRTFHRQWAAVLQKMRENAPRFFDTSVDYSDLE